jgi:hypothetical protein
MLDAVIKEVNNTLEPMNREQLYQTAFDLMVDTYKQEFNDYIDNQTLDLFRGVCQEITLAKEQFVLPRKDRIDLKTDDQLINHLLTLYQMALEYAWKLIGERKYESKHRGI